jgi:hypothetical protein
MHLLILVPALITCEAHVEMVRVQSLLRDRLRRCADANGSGVSVHSCIVFDAVGPPFLNAVLDFDYSIKFYGTQLYPDAPEPTGIRRPCEQALVQLGRTFKPWDSTYVLRIGQDVYVRDATSLFIALHDLMGRPDEFLAGGFDTCSDVHAFLAQLSIPRSARYRYVQGALMFARLDVWLRYFPRLPPDVVHFCDDSVMSQMVKHAGGALLGLDRCWDHRHGCPPDESRQAYREHLLELGNGRAAPSSPAFARLCAAPAPVRPRLDALAHRSGTDKRSGEHGYTRCYEELWGSRRDEPLTLLEFGVGAGDSLRMWKEYFPNAQIAAVDVAEGARGHADSRVSVFVGRQDDEALPGTVARAFPGGFDIIIDDGGPGLLPYLASVPAERASVGGRDHRRGHRLPG